MSLASLPAPIGRAVRNQKSDRAPIARSVSALAVIGLSLSMASCGLIVDTDRQQCKTPADCAKALGGAATGYTCEESLCRTSSACTPETLAESCGDSPTVQCVGGACVDDTWGCWDQADRRPAPTQSTAPVKIKFLTVFTQAPPMALNGVLCRTPTIDPTCGTALPGTSVSYTASSGELTASGVTVSPFYIAYRLKVDAPASEMLRPLDYYTTRPPRDGDVPIELTMLPVNIADLLPQELQFDRTKGNIIARIYDCNDKLAAGVEVTMVDPPSNLGHIYSDDSGQLSTTLTKTSSRGISNLYNVPVDRVVTVVVKVSATKQIQFGLRAYADRHSFLDVHPGKFE